MDAFIIWGKMATQHKKGSLVVGDGGPLHRDLLWRLTVNRLGSTKILTASSNQILRSLAQHFLKLTL